MALVEILDINGQITSSGSVMTNVAIDGTGDNAQLKVYSGGLVSGGSITGAGRYTLSSGGTLENVTLNLTGASENYAKGILSGCTISNGGDRTRLYGGSAYNCTVAAGGRLDGEAGASGYDTKVSGSLYLYGTVFSNTTVYAGAVNLLNGGRLEGAVISGGTVSAREGSVKDVVMYGGGLQVSNGCRAEDVTVSDGTLTVYSAGRASGVTMTGGSGVVLSGATISGVNAAGGTVIVSSGGVASDVNMSGGTLKVSGGAVISGGSLTGNAALTLYAGGVLENVTLNNTTTNGTSINGVYSNCIIAHANASRSRLYGGAAAYNCTVTGRMDLEVASVVGSGNQIYGNLRFHGAATFTDTTLYKGADVLVNAGTADGLTISGGLVNAKGGTLKNVTMYDGTVNVSSATCTMSAVTISGGTISVSSGATASDVTMEGGTVNVRSDGTVSGGTLNGGTLNVSGGGAVSDGAVNANGTLAVSAGASVTGMSLTGGAVSVAGAADLTAAAGTFSYADDVALLTNGVDAEVTVSGGSIALDGGNYAQATVRGGELTLQNAVTGGALAISGGTVNVADATVGGDNVALTGGTLNVNDGGVASGVTVSGGTLAVASDGMAADVTVSSGTLSIASGGRASGGLIATRGGFNLASGGVLEEFTIAQDNGGAVLTTYQIGTFSNCTVGSDTHLILQEYAQSLNNVVSGNYRIDLTDHAYGSGNVIRKGGMKVYTTAVDTVLSGGELEVYTGATLSGVTATGGTMYVYGGVVSGGSISDNAVLSVSAGAVLENVTLSNASTNGTITRGTLSSCTINHGGASRTRLYGGAAYNCTVNGRMDVDVASVVGSGNQIYGELRLHAAATFNDTTLYSGYLLVQGGTADGVTISGGTVDAKIGAMKNVTMYGGTVNVMSSTCAVSGVTISGGTIRVSSGATASDVTMDGGTVNVSNGGAVSGGTVNANGTLAVSAGASVTGMSLTGGTVNVGGSADLTAAAGTFSYADDVALLTDGNAAAVTVSGGSVALDGGTYAQATVRGGELTLQNAVTGGALAVSGGTVNVADAIVGGDNVALTGGTLNVNNGGMASGLNFSGGTLNVSGGGVASDVTLSGGTLAVASDGMAADVTVSSGTLSIASGGRASGGLIATRGGFNVAEGGVLEGFTIAKSNNKNPVTLYQNGIFSNCTITDDTFIIMQGGKSLNNVVSGNFRIDLTMDAYGSGNVIRKGGMKIYTTAHDTILSGGYVDIYAGANVSGVTATAGTVTIYAGGSAANVNMTGGTLIMQSGTVLSGGSFTGSAGLSVNAAAVMKDVIIGRENGGAVVTMYFSNVTSNCTITNDAFVNVNSGAQSLNNVVSGNYRIDLLKGAYGSGNVIRKGGIKVSAGATAVDTIVSGADGTLEIYSGAIVSGVTALGGKVAVLSGATASAVTMNGGTANVSSAATVFGGTINGGTMNVLNGATASAVTMDGGAMNVSSGATASAVTMSGGTLNVSGGALLESATISGGDVNIYSGAVVSNTSMQGKCTKLYSISGGTFKDWSLAGGVSVSVYGNITLEGTITIAGQVYLPDSAKDVTITADTATVIFDTVNYQSGINGMFYRLEKLQGANELRIAVSSASEVGSTYELTDKATLTGFSRNFYVYKDGNKDENKIGYVTLNNTTVTGLVQGSKAYTLNPDYVENRGYKVQFQVLSSLVKDLAVTADDSSTTVAWDAVKGVSYQVSVDGGSTWEAASGSSYTYDGTAKKDVQVRMADTQGNYGTVSEITVAGTAEGTAVASLVDNASAGATIVLRDGSYTSGGVITMKAGQTLEGQGTDPVSGTILTTVTKAIYGAGNAVTIKDLKASTNVAGGAVNGATSTDLTVESAQLKDAFAGSLVNAGTVEVASAGADLAGTTFRNLYGAGYATGSGNVLNNTTVELTVSGGCSRTDAGYGSIYGAGRAANGATLTAGTVNVTVDNGNATKLGALYAGGYTNNGTVSTTAANVTITSGDFAKFVAAGAQVYGASAESTIGNTNLTISGGTFDNAVLGASYAAGGASASVTSATTEISGGTFHGYVAGGGYVNASTLTVGAVDLTISGGTFTKYVFGGNLGGSSAAAGTVTNAVNLTLDATSNAISANVIYAGSMNSGAVGSTEVELKGDGSKLSFTKLYGGGSYSGTQTGGVTGTKALTFTGFSGELSGKLYDFDTFTMSGSTVSFTQAQTLSDVSTWDLALTSDVTDENALINWSQGSNSFAGDTMKLTFNAASEDDLLVIEGGDGLDLSLSKDMTVTFNGNAASYSNGAWSFGDWKLSNVNDGDGVNNLVLSKVSALA